MIFALLMTGSTVRVMSVKSTVCVLPFTARRRKDQGGLGLGNVTKISV